MMTAPVPRTLANTKNVHPLDEDITPDPVVIKMRKLETEPEVSVKFSDGTKELLDVIIQYELHKKDLITKKAETEELQLDASNNQESIIKTQDDLITRFKNVFTDLNTVISDYKDAMAIQNDIIKQKDQTIVHFRQIVAHQKKFIKEQKDIKLNQSQILSDKDQAVQSRDATIKELNKLLKQKDSQIAYWKHQEKID
ncbi:hypothetical protein TBLA_0D02440 [Henningerozyma blattae CBS 6284]|uniref:Uncharacterized protein n=1 Tax=Henningerozyma blattae (strain ATCC 34711 / CBS 6284 / DSM 70876 / NBRC 10599 / NRRL Y-10934 / UCD 77-7) TaxID=1071380 RepID=I2H2Z6_HENB6|nr:hypothetical protein TBLA_0D02440 [Tetrapisispora blattae CBS 6284]CCH60748.1 hypothetical protein TBLA_0D02440 [Tetrapisispora blattae CBS 6284]